MRTKSPVSLIITLVFASMLAAACGPQNIPGAAPQAWIDAPLGGSTIPLAPYQIIAHAGSPAGIAQFELTITGQSAQTIPAPADQAGQTLVYINQMWTPPSARHVSDPGARGRRRWYVWPNGRGASAGWRRD